MARTSRWNANIAFRSGHDDIPGFPLRALPEFADRVAGLHPENRLIPIESVIDARYHGGGIFTNNSLALALADGSQLTFRWSGLWMLLPEIEQLALVNQPTLMRVMFGDASRSSDVVITDVVISHGMLERGMRPAKPRQARASGA